MTQKPSGAPGEPPYLTVALAPDPYAASLARTLVADACLAWRLPELLHPARRVMSELVLNAVEHAGTDLVVTITRRGTGLRLAVSDGESRLPRLRVPAPVRRGAPLDERGRGLQVVRAAASGWGAVRTPTGKVVWAVVQGVPSAGTRLGYGPDSRPSIRHLKATARAAAEFTCPPELL